MSLALEWHGQQEFTSEPLRSWKIDDKVVGTTRSAGLLTYATIVGAGHMVRLPLNFMVPVLNAFRLHMINPRKH